MNGSKERPGLTTPDDQRPEETGVERFEGAIVRQGGSPLQTIAWTLMGVVGVFGAAASADWRGVALMGSLSLLVWVLVFPRIYRHVRRRRNVAVGPEGLFVEGRLFVPRGEIIAAHVAPLGARARVTVQWSAGPDVNVDVATEEQGRRLVRALDREGSERAATFVLQAPETAWRMAGLVLGCIVLLAVTSINLWWRSRFGWVPANFGQLLLVLLTWAYLWLGRSTVTIGTDGIFIRGFRRRELVRFADIERTELRDDKRQLWLHLRGGRSARLGAKNERGLADAMASLRSLEERIREMRAASDSEQASPIGARTVPPRDWIRSLRGALDKGAPGFRARALVPEELWRAMENARLSATARAAAAIALGPTLDEQGKARLRIAADASADPKLRVLFGAVTDNDEDAIEDALGEIEAMDEEARQTAATSH